MSDLIHKDLIIHSETLVQILSVVDVLTVSMDRIGSYQLLHGREAAKESLIAFFDPHLNNRISKARSQILRLLDEQAPDIVEYYEELTEDGEKIGYWQGPPSAFSQQ